MPTICIPCNDYKEIFNETCVECGSFYYMLICACCASPHNFNPDEVCPSCVNAFDIDSPFL